MNLDVKTSFLHGDLDEDIYMQQPEGFKAPCREELVYILQKKSLWIEAGFETVV